ncbi:MAG: hypothetical protein JW828_11210 [Sedimentisphaerales bacterium]|nr:hypothetical protein [Sedimentisphaerales bacterium]
MASIAQDPNGRKRIQFFLDGKLTEKKGLPIRFVGVFGSACDGIHCLESR